MSSTASQTARGLARVELTRVILERAAVQLAEVGPAALSVRAIARELGMSSSALYRYFRSRNELLTALLIEAFTDLALVVEAADLAAAQADLRARFRGMCSALRAWSIEHPHEYALAYGSPVPGFVAPIDTVAAATRVPVALLNLVKDAQEEGRALTATRPATPAERAAVTTISALVEPPLRDDWTVRALMVWTTLFGHVSLELFGHMANAVLDYDAHFAQVTEQLADDLGL